MFVVSLFCSIHINVHTADDVLHTWILPAEDSLSPSLKAVRLYRVRVMRLNGNMENISF